MKSLAELKRILKSGTRLRCVENTYRPELNGKMRLVTRTQANGFWWIPDDSQRQSWTEYPKASLFMFDGTNKFTFSLKMDNHFVTLEIL